MVVKSWLCRALPLALISSLAVSGCGREGRGSAVAEIDTVATASASEKASARKEREQVRIYFDLTKHAWYKHGEPLVHDGQSYVPQGKPVGFTLDNLQRAGDYQGVEFYVRREDSEPYDAVYVPVFEGYWLAFVPQKVTSLLDR